MSKIGKKTSQNDKPTIKLNFLQKLLLFICFVFLIFLAFPAVVIITIGLLPTITVLLTDSKNINKLTIVGCFNLAGVFICLMNIFTQFNLDQAFSIIGNIFNVIIMLSSAAFGVIVYYELPNLFIWISKTNTQRRLKAIDNKLQKLTDEWGKENLS